MAGFDVVTQAAAVRRNIGVTAQDATVDVLLTGRQNLVMIGELSRLRRADAKARPTSCSSGSTSSERPIASSRGTRAACAGASTSPPAS